MHVSAMDRRLPSPRQTGRPARSSGIAARDVTDASLAGAGSGAGRCAPARAEELRTGRRVTSAYTLPGVVMTGRRRFLVAVLLCAAPAAAPATTFRYDRDLNLITIENGGVATLSALRAALPAAPLSQVDAERRIWLLAADVLITNNSVLRLHGGAGGDVNELRLRSDNLRTPRSFVSVTADHGTIDIRSTRITSWDTVAGEPDREYETYGRAFIRARSRLRSMVLTALQSRMDIVDSEIAFLGYNANESYGLVWKVVAPEPYVFDYVRVHGNVLRSRIHDNYFGIYTSGVKDAEWRGNQVHHNVQYGLAPHTRSDDVRIEDNDVHDNGNHGITARQNCARMVIRNNRVWGNGESGITLHRDSNDGVVTGNRVYRNRDIGIMVYASARTLVRDNIVRENGHIGVQLAMGARDNRVERNDIGDNGFYGMFVGKGRGRPRAGDGQPRRNHIARNTLYGSGVEDLRMGEPSLNHYVDNTFLMRALEDGALADAEGGGPFDPFPRPPAMQVAAAGDTVNGAGPPDPALRTAGRSWRLAALAFWGGLFALVAALLLTRGGRNGRA